jgi:hypothetical protein
MVRVQHRQLLEYCDILLKQMVEQNKGLIDPNLLMNHLSGVPLKDVVNYMVSQGHIKLLNHPFVQLLPEARLFYHRTSYVEEFDKEYESAQISDELSKLELSNARRVFKTYPWTQLIAWVTFGISIVLVFLEIAKALHIWPYHKSG